jgi:peptide chain release factor 1
MLTFQISKDETGGTRSVEAHVRGIGVFSKLQHESGVHRVQRVPKTETQGRVHTSTASVAIFPPFEQADVRLTDSDLLIEYTTSCGPGGQSVNKSHSAVRIVHIPTGLQVLVQEQRNAVMNKERALQLLQSKLLAAEHRRIVTERKSSRQDQIGCSERSEKIRTYNFPQSRVTDHRIGVSFYDIKSFLDGNHLATIATRLDSKLQDYRLAQIEAMLYSSD